MTITLLDGTEANTDQIDFDPSTYHFSLNGQDVTALIKRTDKIANWSNFDPAVDNTRLSNEAHNGVNLPQTDLPTSTVGIFTNQILTDPLAAPIDSFKSAVSKGWNDLTGGSTVVKIGIIAGVAIVALILLKRE